MLQVGAGIKNSGVKREDVTLVSKLWNTGHRPAAVEPELDLTLAQLGTSYLDLYLIHWPVPFPSGKGLAPKNADKTQTLIDTDAPSVSETWREMLRILNETDKVRAVGVSNFTVEQLALITKATGVAPAVNQIEGHPQLIQPELFRYCKDNGITITAYSPLGNNITGKARVLDSPTVKAIAQRNGVEPAQVLIAWGAKNGFAVIPKSVTPSRIAVSAGRAREERPGERQCRESGASRRDLTGTRRRVKRKGVACLQSQSVAGSWGGTKRPRLLKASEPTAPQYAEKIPRSSATVLAVGLPAWVLIKSDHFQRHAAQKACRGPGL
jgi:L-glyceraldehyde reductase